MAEAADRLAHALSRYDAIAIAVSGGVDSITLATFAHRRISSGVEMIHAASPAVPGAATARLCELARSEGWRLTITDAEELADPRYRDNPANRCYFCKSNLYDRMRAITSVQLASGANLDDLADYRPGLLAAGEREVVHPFIEAKMGKAAIRHLARALGLPEIAELPAQPCLASRIETGIVIEAQDLAFVDRVERGLAASLPRESALRCRITHAGIVVESETPLPAEADALVLSLCAAAGRTYLGARPYRRGSMFRRDAT